MKVDPMLSAGAPSGPLDHSLADCVLAMSMLTALPVQVALLDVDGTILQVNQAWRDSARENGGGEAVCEGAPYLTVCRRSQEAGDELAGQVLLALGLVLRGELALFTLEYPCRMPDRDAWFLLCTAPAQGGGAVVAHVDITGRKEKEQELSRKEERNRLILGSTSELISTHTMDSRFVFASDAAQPLLGSAPAKLIGSLLLDLVHPQDQDRVRRTYQRLLSGSSQETTRARLRRWDGRNIWVETTFRRLTPSHEPTAELFVAVSRDITEQRESEEQQAELRLSIERAAYEWRSTFDEIHMPILLLGIDRRVRRLNRTAAELLGKDYQAVLGRTFEELGSCQPWQAVSELAERVFEKCAPEVCEAQDETTGRTWEVAVRPSASGDEEVKLVVQVREITETVRLQESLRASETMAVLGSVVGGVAHEVRNPLFGMSAVLDAFESRFDLPEQRPYLTMLRSELSRMTKLMQELLNYGKPARLELQSGNLLDAIHEAMELCRPLASQQQVELALDEPGEGILVQIDQGQFPQALKNLIENSVQHAPEESTVTVSVVVVVYEGTHGVRITVRDQGPGFPEGDIPKRVLEPFFSRRKGGTGLGLPIVARIIEGHKGRLRLQNHREGGAEAEIILPALQPVNL